MNLKDILVKDAANAKTSTFEEVVLAPGMYVAKVIEFKEEDTYQYVAVEINGKRINFFYNYYIYNTTDLDGNLINWIKGLATIPVTETTTLLEIANSAIGSSYAIEVYNYVSKSGKNAGKTQHAIQFKTLPTLETVTIQTEELDDLPY